MDTGGRNTNLTRKCTCRSGRDSLPASARRANSRGDILEQLLPPIEGLVRLRFDLGVFGNPPEVASQQLRNQIWKVDSKMGGKAQHIGRQIKRRFHASISVRWIAEFMGGRGLGRSFGLGVERGSYRIAPMLQKEFFLRSEQDIRATENGPQGGGHLQRD